MVGIEQEERTFQARILVYLVASGIGAAATIVALSIGLSSAANDIAREKSLPLVRSGFVARLRSSAVLTGD